MNTTPTKQYTPPGKPMSESSRTLFRVGIGAVVTLVFMLPVVIGAIGFTRLLGASVTEDTLAFTPSGSRIQVMNSDALVHIETVNGPGYVYYRSVGKKNKPTITTEVKDGVDVVSIDRLPRNVVGVNLFEVTVAIPKDTVPDLSIVADAGSVAVRSGTYRTVDVSMDAAALMFDATATDISVQSNAGLASVEGKARNVMVETDSGSIHVRNLDATGNVDLKTESGTVMYELNTGVQPQQVNLETVTGDVRTELKPHKRIPGGKPYYMNATSSTGQVEVPRDSASSPDGAVPIYAHTESGGIEIEYDPVN